MARTKILKRDKVLSGVTALQLVQEFISDSERGKRVKKNGKRLSHGTITNYTYLYQQLRKFEEAKPGKLKIYVEANLNQRERESANAYYKRFYHHFTEFLYQQGYFDNYVGLIIKCYRAFFNYLHRERAVPIGIFHQKFYVPKEQIQIIALRPAQLKAIINDAAWEEQVKANGLEKVRDIFIVGCTVALRVSDLLALRKSNLLKQGDDVYLQVKSKKTGTTTRLKLPDYVVAIFKKYGKRGTRLLPEITPAWLNSELKRMALLLEDNNEIIKTRERRGKPVVIYKDARRREHYKLSDHMSTHTMRRTAITTMLSLGMPEYMVRQISGHAANSTEFFRYVRFIQDYLDQETEKVFDNLVLEKV